MKKLAAFALLGLALLAAGCPSSEGGASDDDDDDDGASGLGCRDVAISSGVDGNGAGSSVYYTSFIGGTDFSEFLGAGGFADETITLCAGVVSSDGEAALTLEADATEAISLPAENCLCRQFLAAGSSGTLYCAASSDTLDFTSTQDSMAGGAATAEQVTEGPGTVTAAGHARLSFSAKTTGITANPAACTVAACAAALSGITPSDVLYTTGTATSEFTNSTQGGTRTAAATGHSFGDCGEWLTGSVAGALAGAPEHDEDNPDAGPGDVVTVERIAEAP
jgi:hypothetical protein